MRAGSTPFIRADRPAGFEPLWGFSCQVVVFGFCRFFVRSGKAVLRPSPAIRFAERAEGVDGSKW
jgi:hypothetical protein